MRRREFVTNLGGATTTWPLKRAGKRMRRVGVVAATTAPDDAEGKSGALQEVNMAEPDRNGISTRLWRLPGQLLLALINATAILVIVAAILALVAIARIDHFAENAVATMTEAVLSKVDLPPKDVLANLRNLTAEVRTLGNALREIKAGEHPALQSEITQLKEALTVLNVSVGRLGSARSILTDEAIGQLGRTVSDALMKLRDCSSSTRQVAPHRTLRNKTVEAWETAGPQKAGICVPPPGQYIEASLSHVG